MDVKDCIATFRRLDAELRDHNKGLDQAREEYNKLDAEHATRVAEWDAEKGSMMALLDQAIEEEATVALDAEAMEKAAEHLLNKVTQRQKKNDEHNSTLMRHRGEIERQSEQLESRDAGIKAELEGFRDAREATREQLMATVQELEAHLPRIQSEHQAKAGELRKRIEDVEEKIASEARQWALEMARRERDAKKRAVQLLNEEAQFAMDGKNMWSEMLRTSVPASCANETAKEVAYLRHQLMRTHA